MSFAGLIPESYTQFVTNAPAGSAPTAADIIALIQGGITKKVSPWYGLLAAPTTIVTAGATYNASTGDMFIGVNKTIGSPTSIVLPAAASLFLGRTFEVADVKGDASTNPITITGSGGLLFDGQTSFVLAFNYQAATFRWTGAGFQVL